MNARRGFFISFEGVEGSGKSTQMRMLVDRLRGAGLSVVENQEPGGTAIGKEIRRILLDPANSEMTAMTELLLMFASRTQAADEIIRPALEQADFVITDRFTDSTLAYQGFARGLGFETVFAAHRLALERLMPDLTIVIEFDVGQGLARAHRRNEQSAKGLSEERLDRQSLGFHQRVAEGYRAIAQSDPERVKMVDGRGKPEEVAGRVWSVVSTLGGLKSRLED
jgi:dTMP kinase